MEGREEEEEEQETVETQLPQLLLLLSYYALIINDPQPSPGNHTFLVQICKTLPNIIALCIFYKMKNSLQERVSSAYAYSY